MKTNSCSYLFIFKFSMLLGVPPGRSACQPVSNLAYGLVLQPLPHHHPPNKIEKRPLNSSKNW